MTKAGPKAQQDNIATRFFEKHLIAKIKMIFYFIITMKYDEIFYLSEGIQRVNKKSILNFNQQSLYRDNDIAVDEDVCSADIGKDTWDFAFRSLNAFLFLNSSDLSDSSDRSNFHSVIQITAIQAGILYFAFF